MVGYKNAGKTNILKSCNWILRKTSLSKEDFNDKNKAVEIEAEIIGISADLIDRLDEKHKKKITEFVINEKLEFKGVQSKF